MDKSLKQEVVGIIVTGREVIYQDDWGWLMGGILKLKGYTKR